MRNVLILGASGSIGSQTLDILKAHRNSFCLKGISVGKRVEKIPEILSLFPSIKGICIGNKEDGKEFERNFPNLHFYYGDEGLLELISKTECDLVVNALVGFVGFLPTLQSLEQNKDVALANKESLVVGGALVNQLLKEHPSAHLYPIDSEHVALAKCLHGNRKDVKRLVLTASGGSFRDLTREQLRDVTKEQALCHPSWKMGHKITIDCATMMNKGFEVIEAHYLYQIPMEKIAILLHDESKIHSLVEFCDGTFLADIGPSDMRVPISYALWGMKRKKEKIPSLPLDEFHTFHFRPWDENRYPCVGFAYLAMKMGGTAPAALNAANEVAVSAFLQEEIPFLAIEKVIEKVLRRTRVIPSPTKEDIVYADRLAREEARRVIKEEKQ